MADVPRVPLGHRPAGSWLPALTAGVLIFLAVVIWQPWTPPPPAAIAPTAGPTFYVYADPTERTGHRPYDPRLFGNKEPEPAWELWPAGYVVQFGLAGPVQVHGQDGASPGPGASASASANPTAAPSPAATASGPSIGHVIDLGPTDHLIALGINTPLSVRIEKIELWVLVEGATTGGEDEVAIVRLPTLWESTHFLVIGVEDPNAPGQAGPWPPGLYRLDLTTPFGEIREVLLRVQPPADG